MGAKKVTQLAMLTGIALIIFVVEMQIPNPFPIPGVKLGLANVITVYAIYRCRAREVMMIVLARILLASLFGGSPVTFLYSLAGSILCLAGMLPLKRIIDEKHIWISSVFGAVLHNIGQIALAVVMLGIGVLVYFPFLLVSGCLAGAFTGCCAQLVIKKLDNNKNR